MLRKGCPRPNALPSSVCVGIKKNKNKGGQAVAIFHLNFKVLTRTTKSGKSKSSLYLAAYNAREKLTDEITGLTFNYTKKNDLYKCGIILPENAPAEFYDRSTLWNKCEAAEKRKDSQICRTAILALCKELNGEQNEALLKKYLKQNFIKEGMIADYAIHDINGKPHAHIMLTMRRVTEKGFDSKKERRWNDPKLAEIWRRKWSVLVNKTLKENGHNNTITHLSFLRQKELAITKAKEELEKNNIKKAEELINLAKKLATKKPVKRKPTKQYLKDKTRKKNKNIELRQRLKQQQEQKEENNKKGGKLKLIFDNLVLKFNKAVNKNKKEEVARITEADFLKEMKPDEYIQETKKEDFKIQEIKNEKYKIRDSAGRFENTNIHTNKRKI